MMIPYLSYLQDIPVRVIRNRRIWAKVAVYAGWMALMFIVQFVAVKNSASPFWFPALLLADLALLVGGLGYFAYRHFFSVPLQLEPCPYCADFLGYNFVAFYWPIHNLSVCGACMHDFDTPFDSKDMRPGSFETPPKSPGLQGG